ncbi:MAG: hypothetical protein ABTD50_12775 [Polyangiaceae bacterium]
MSTKPGTAQRPLGQPWRPNPGGRRSVADAVALAKDLGVVVEDDVRIVVNDAWLNMQGAEVYAAYAGFTSTRPYTWDDLLIRGKMVVKLRSTVLDSDEGIVEVLAHEMHEINTLRGMFEARSSIPGAELIELLGPGRPGNLHDKAWDVGAGVLRRLRGGIK